MSGIVGKINFKDDISNGISVIGQMAQALKRRGPDTENLFIEKHCNFAQMSSNMESNQIKFVYEGITYIIVCDGKIYNIRELRKDLEENRFEILTNDDLEVLLKCYIFYGKDVCKKLNGVFAFAIWNNQTEEVFIARDHFGVKPLYFSIENNNFLFASEIKALLEHPGVKPVIDQVGISELFGIGPAHTPGLSPFKNIYEVKPAHFIIYNKHYYMNEEYWKLESKEHIDDLETTAEKIRYLLKDSIEMQIDSDDTIVSALSGGIDSSIITAFASKYFKEKFNKQLVTLSVDYVDNEKNFVKNDFQPNTDNYYINLMIKKYNTDHKNIMLDTPELFEYLEDAMIARDLPGMADVDSSYLLFFKEIKKHNANIVLSGECSDEIFGGYPWYFRKNTLESKTFPWSLAIKERQNLLNSNISKKVNLKEYVDNRYENSLRNVEILKNDTEQNKLARKLIYLTSNWFMQTLLDRTDRMCMYSGVDVRVPFCDYRIVEYVWNIPWEMKAYNGREKGLLRYSMKDILPEEIVERKKSPYPKTFNPTYTKIVRDKLREIMKDKNAPINNLLDRDYIFKIIETNGIAFSKPWFGQLMTGPQLMAYLIQLNMWLERYNPEIDI